MKKMLLIAMAVVMMAGVMAGCSGKPKELLIPVGFQGYQWGMSSEDIRSMESEDFVLLDAKENRLTYNIVDEEDMFSVYAIIMEEKLKTTFTFEEDKLVKIERGLADVATLDLFENQFLTLKESFGEPSTSEVRESGGYTLVTYAIFENEDTTASVFFYHSKTEYGDLNVYYEKKQQDVEKDKG